MRWSLGWVPLVFLMIVNGAVRESVYGPRMSELQAHQLSTVTAALIYFVYLWFVFGWLQIRTGSEAWRLGFLWLALTIAFEFGLGLLFAGGSMSSLLAEYDLLAGRVWSLFLLWVLLAPPLVFLARRPPANVGEV